MITHTHVDISRINLFLISGLILAIGMTFGYMAGSGLEINLDSLLNRTASSAGIAKSESMAAI